MKKSRKADQEMRRTTTSFATAPPGRDNRGAPSRNSLAQGSWLSVALGTLVGFALVVSIVTLGVIGTAWALRSSAIIAWQPSLSQSVVVACLIVAWKVAGLSFASAVRR